MRFLARLSIPMFVESTRVAICGNWVDLTAVVLSCSIDHVFVPYFDLVLENCCFSGAVFGAVRIDEGNKLSHLEGMYFKLSVLIAYVKRFLQLDMRFIMKLIESILFYAATIKFWGDIYHKRK